MNPATTLEALRAALSTEVGVRFAVVFGSLARDTLHPGSDVDVGFLPADGDAFSLADELALAGRLASAARRDVDLVRIDTASTQLAFHIARDAVLVCGEPSELSRFRARAAIDHADYAEVALPAARLLAARIAGRASP